MARAPVTNRLLGALNAAKGLKYPDVGFSYFADVKGSGVYSPAVYTIINAAGGVTRSPLNGDTARERCQRIRAAIEEAAR